MAPPRRNAGNTTFYSFLKLISTSLSPHLPGWWKVMAFSLPTMGPLQSSKDFVVGSSNSDPGRLLFLSREESQFLDTCCCLRQSCSLLHKALLPAWVFLYPSCAARPCVPRSCCNSHVLQREAALGKPTLIAGSPKGQGSYDFPNQIVSGGQPFSVFPLFFSGSQL